jgi:hypothetical protein
MMADLRDEGTIEFWGKGPQADWATNARGYNFPTIENHGVTMKSSKNPDMTVSVSLIGN